MSEIVLLDRHDDGVATAHYRDQRWKRVPGDGPEAIAKWLTDNDHFEPASTVTRRVLERAYGDHQTPTPVRHAREKWERKAGQSVYHSEFGLGKIIATIDSKIVVKFGKNERVMRAEELTTRAEAESDCYFYWSTGERRRLEEGKRLFIVKSLCEFGEWQTFLDKYSFPRSTANDLIKRFEDELRWEARGQLSGHRTSLLGDVRRQINKRTRDSEDDARKELVKDEADARRGREPSHHSDYWSVRIKLPPDVAAECRERYKRGGNNAKEYWQNAAYNFVELDLDVSASSSEEELGNGSYDSE